MSNDASAVELGNSEALCGQVLARLPVIVCELAEDGTALYVNDAVEAATGYRPDEIVGRSWWGLLGPEDRRPREPIRAPSSADGRVQERLLRAKDGSERRLEWHLFGQRRKSGKLESSLYCGVDVTERARRAEAEAARRQIAAILESITDAFLAVDERWCFTFVNQEAERFLGRSREELLGRSLWEAYPDLLGSVFEQAYRRAVTEQTTVELEAFYPSPARWVNVRAYPAQAGLSISLRDVTQHRHAEAARERLVAIIEATTDFVATADSSGRVLYFNRAARRMLGIGEHEDISSITIPDTHPEWANELVLNEGIPTALREGLWAGQTALSSRAGQEIPISQVILAHRDPDGKVEYLSTIGRDESERKHLEQLRKEYIQAMSHDLRSPLSAIGMQAHLLHGALAEVPLTADVKRSLEVISRGVRRMAEMIQDLAESAQMEGGEPRLERQAITPRPFVIDLLEGSGLVIRSERVRVEIPADCPPVLADASCLERIFSNLLGNALKYSPESTCVSVGARLDGDVVVLSVSDEGPGIAETDLPHIFERFYRAGEARRIEGLGLGLYISRKLVEAQGGRIWVESRAERGTTFHFTLPRPPAARSS